MILKQVLTLVDVMGSAHKGAAGSIAASLPPAPRSVPAVMLEMILRTASAVEQRRSAVLMILLAASGCTSYMGALAPAQGQAVLKAEDIGGDVTITGIDGQIVGPTRYEVSGPAGQHIVAFEYARFPLTGSRRGSCPPAPLRAAARIDLLPAHIYEIRQMENPFFLLDSVGFAIVDLESGATVWQGWAERKFEEVCI